MSPWPQVVVQPTQFGMASMAMWLSDTNLAPGGGPDCWPQHGLQWRQESQTSTQGLGPRLALGNSPGLDITLDSGDKRAIRISLFLTTLTSLDLPLFLAHELKHLSVSLPPSHPVLARHKVSDGKVPQVPELYPDRRTACCRAVAVAVSGPRTPATV